MNKVGGNSARSEAPGMGRLDGKRALISGTGGGIGRATALLCAREGAHVVGCDLNAETSAETVELARASGGRMDTVARAPLGRWGQPEDVAHAILFLSSDESSHVSGANIPVDGGAAVVG
jgi:NAD(P)-dependent dehydrogenase (short-subunit alcohol dehydrogenase family)